MKLVVSCVYGMFIGLFFVVPANSGVVAAVTTIAEFYERGKQWQAKQSWGKFKAYKYGQTVKFGNFTGSSINIAVESHCVTERPTLNNNIEYEFACDNDGNGDDHYILVFNGQRYSVRGYTYTLFERNLSGAISFRTLSLEDMAKFLEESKAASQLCFPLEI